MMQADALAANALSAVYLPMSAIKVVENVSDVGSNADYMEML